MKRIDEKFKKELYDIRKQSDSTGYPVEYTDEMVEDTDEMTEEERTIRESCLKLPRLRAIGFRKRMMLKKFM